MKSPEPWKSPPSSRSSPPDPMDETPPCEEREPETKESISYPCDHPWG